MLCAHLPVCVCAVCPPAGLSDEELLARLTAVRGIGPWTVDMVSQHGAWRGLVQLKQLQLAQLAIALGRVSGSSVSAVLLNVLAKYRRACRHARAFWQSERHEGKLGYAVCCLCMCVQFAMFHLGHPNILPVGDLGVRKVRLHH